jgi:hypothetical protein
MAQGPVKYNTTIREPCFFFWRKTGGVKPLLICFVNKKYKGVYKEKAYININCAVVQDSTQQQMLNYWFLGNKWWQEINSHSLELACLS